MRGWCGGELSDNMALSQAQAAATAHKRSREELPHVRGQGQRPRAPGCNGAGTSERSYRLPEAPGGGQEELPQVQGAVAARAQKGLEELLHVQGQEGRWWGDTPCPR